MTTATFEKTTDPRWVKPASYSPLERLFLPLLRDERDLIFVRVQALMTVTVLPLGLGMFFLEPWMIGLVALPYIAFVFLGFGGRYGLMLHATGHRPIYKREYKWMQAYIPWVLGPFLGHTPTSFDAHHMWMHHAENNMFGDGSCTLAYKRDHFPHFLHYWARFFFMGHIHVSRYLQLRGRTKVLRRFWFGELFWLALAAVALWVNWAAALLVFIVPVLMMRWLMMAGNWSQHAFIDLDNPDDGYGNSTCLTNTRYNHKAYNDGYHIIHHNRPGMHWSEMAQAYEDRLDEFIAKDAVVFDGIADNQQIWFLLMFGRWDTLADHLVDFKGRTHEEKVAFLQSRVHGQAGELPPFFALETPQRMAETDRKTGKPIEEILMAE